MTDTSLVRRTGSTPFMEPFFGNLDRFFSDAFNDSFFRPFFGGTNQRGWLPPVDMRETDDAYEVSVELPGLTKNDVDVTVENNLLTISGERKWDEGADQDSYRRLERAYGRFSRSFTLPRQVDSDSVKAKFENGLLYLTLPKAEEARPRRIAIH